MRAKILLMAVILVLTGFNASAQQACEVIEAEQAQVVGEDSALERGMTLTPDTAVVTGSEGQASFLCGNEILTVPSDSEGEIREIGTSETVGMDNDIGSEVEISEALERTGRMEENLDRINQRIDEVLPSPLKSLVLGDRVNFVVDDTTLGIKSNESEITGFEQGGVENPTLEIRMNETTIEEVLDSNNSRQAFSQAYNTGEIDVKSYSFRNKVIFGAVDIANTALGFFSDLM